MIPPTPPQSLPGWLPSDERKALRIQAQLTAELKGERLDPSSVTLTDVSELGCQIASAQKISVGSFVTLTVPNFTSFTGWVAWKGEGAYGIDFAHPLLPAVVERIVELGRALG
jgi:hypothetical protein